MFLTTEEPHRNDQALGRWDTDCFSVNIRGWEGADWSRYVLAPSDPYYESWRHIYGVPCGIYALWSEDSGLLYIGLSTNIKSRIRAHEKRGVIPFQSVSYVEVPDIALQAVETAHIFALSPPYNAKYDESSWTGHPFMVDAIRIVWNAARVEESC